MIFFLAQKERPLPHIPNHIPPVTMMIVPPGSGQKDYIQTDAPRILDAWRTRYKSKARRQAIREASRKIWDLYDRDILGTKEGNQAMKKINLERNEAYKKIEQDSRRLQYSNVPLWFKSTYLVWMWWD